MSRRNPSYTIRLRLSRTAFLVTLLVTVGMTLAALLSAVYASAHGDFAVVCIVVILFLTLLPVVIVAEGLAPQCIEVDDERIVIVRRYKSVEIRRSAILSITPLESRIVRTSLCEVGNYGLFGFYGIFRSRTLGKYNLYATSLHDLVLITTPDRKIVVNCPEFDRLVGGK